MAFYGTVAQTTWTLQMSSIVMSDDPSFVSLHNSTDNVMRELRKDGVGAQSKSAEVFNKEEEHFIWDGKVLGIHNPWAMLWAVLFLNGKKFVPMWQRLQVLILAFLYWLVMFFLLTVN